MRDNIDELPVARPKVEEILERSQK